LYGEVYIILKGGTLSVLKREILISVLSLIILVTIGFAVLADDSVIFHEGFENPDEDGIPFGWKAKNAAVSIVNDPKIALAGQSCVLIKDENREAYGLLTSSKIPVEPNTKYTFSGWAKLTRLFGTEGTLTAFVYQYNKDGKQTGTTRGITFDPMPSWNLKFREFETAADASVVEIQIYPTAQGANHIGECYFDEFEIRRGSFGSDYFAELSKKYK
jgi:hypothetical protein